MGVRRGQHTLVLPHSILIHAIYTFKFYVNINLHITLDERIETVVGFVVVARRCLNSTLLPTYHKIDQHHIFLNL